MGVTKAFIKNPETVSIVFWLATTS
jgi:hypothetical protein